MRYFYEEKDGNGSSGITYRCDHPMYNACTLYLQEGRGLAVIQQRFSKHTKTLWWGPINKKIVDDIFEQPGFDNYFNETAGEPNEDGLYPTVTIREIMWALRMKPLKKQFWETLG